MRYANAILCAAVAACLAVYGSPEDAPKPSPSGSSSSVAESPPAPGSSTGAGPKAGETRSFAGIEFSWIPAGTFTMGSPPSEDGHQENERQHRVTITKGFWMGVYEVTQEQWKSVMGGNPARFVDDKKPVETVSHVDCGRFIDRLNGKGEGRFRLPTEAEWEYACRAGTTTAFSFGNDVNDFFEYGNASKEEEVEKEEEEEDKKEKKETTPVGTFKPNPWGLYDMHGNVSEWCSDLFENYSGEDAVDPKGASSNNLLVHRGGSYTYRPIFARSAFRYYATEERRYPRIGLRLVREGE